MPIRFPPTTRGHPGKRRSEYDVCVVARASRQKGSSHGTADTWRRRRESILGSGWFGSATWAVGAGSCGSRLVLFGLRDIGVPRRSRPEPRQAGSQFIPCAVERQQAGRVRPRCPGSAPQRVLCSVSVFCRASRNPYPGSPGRGFFLIIPGETGSPDVGGTHPQGHERTPREWLAIKYSVAEFKAGGRTGLH